MKNRIFVSILALLSLSLIIAFLYGCAGTSVSTPWIYLGSQNNNTILIINGSTNTSSEPIELGAYKPHAIAASPDGKKIYCSTDIDHVLIIDTATNTKTGSFEVVNSRQSAGMAVSHDGNFLYMTGTTTNEFFKIYLNGGYTYETTALYDKASRIALDATSTRAYVCGGVQNAGNTYLNKVYLQTMTVESVDLGNYPHDLIIKDGYVYVAMHSMFGNLAIVNMNDISDFKIFIFSPEREYWGIVNVPGTNKVYISRAIPIGEVHTTTTSTGTIEFDSLIIITGESFANPGFMAATASKVYVVDIILTDKVAVIDVASDKIEKYIYGLNGNLYYNNPVIIYK